MLHFSAFDLINYLENIAQCCEEWNGQRVSNLFTDPQGTCVLLDMLLDLQVGQGSE